MINLRRRTIVHCDFGVHRLATRRVATVLLVTLLHGCRSWTGLDAGTKFACHAPEGVLCESMSGIYANAMAKSLPGQAVRQHRSKRVLPPPGSMPVTPVGPSSLMTTPLHTELPLRSAPRVLRVWFAPWEDGDGDWHDQSHLYLVVDHGKWLLDHHRRNLASTYKPLSDGGVVGRSGSVVDRPVATQAVGSDPDSFKPPNTFELMAPVARGDTQ